MVDTQDLWAYLNGKMVRGKDAVVPIYDRGLQWGDAVYDTVRTYSGTPFRLDYRTDRFFRSLQYARIDIGMTKEELKKVMGDVIEANKPLLEPNEDLGYNYYVSRGSMTLTNGLTPAGIICIIPRTLPFASFARFYLKGAPAIAPATRRTPPQSVSPKAKIANKMNHNVAELEAKASNPDAYAIMLDLDGNITESSGANFLFVSEGRIKIPDTRFVLSGADMKAVLELASGIGIGTDEGTYTTYDLYNAQEAFLTTSSSGILPIVSFNGLPIGTGKVGPVTHRLMDAWIDMVGIDFVAQGLSFLPEDERDELTKEWEAVRA
jgi:branched-chain amino acid aminotransferase